VAGVCEDLYIYRLSKDALSGNGILYVPQNVAKRLQKNRQLNKGMDIKLSKISLRKQAGGSLLTSILSLGRTFAPTIAKTLGLSALGGLTSEGASQVVKKITERGQTGGFLIPQNKVDQLITYKYLLTAKQKQDILNALQTGGSLTIRPTIVQSGGFLGSLPALIGFPLAVDMIGKPLLKAITGKGAPQLGRPPLPKSRGGAAPQTGQPPPFIGTRKKTVGQGEKSREGDYY